MPRYAMTRLPRPTCRKKPLLRQPLIPGLLVSASRGTYSRAKTSTWTTFFRRNYWLLVDIRLVNKVAIVHASACLRSVLATAYGTRILSPMRPITIKFRRQSRLSEPKEPVRAFARDPNWPLTSITPRADFFALPVFPMQSPGCKFIGFTIGGA